MELSQKQLEAYDEDGVFFFPSMFSQAEVRVLREEIERCSKLEREEISRSKDNEIQIFWALEGYSRAFDLLLHHPRVVEPAKQLLGPDIYHHQLKVVCKTPFAGIPFGWHHDYDSWLRNDGMLSPGAVNIAIYLDEVDAYNGPLSYVPGSHRAGPGGGRLPTMTYEESGGYLPLIPHEEIARVIDEKGIYGPLGPAGSTVFFSDCIAHASPQSLSPRTRYVVYLTFNRISNALTDPKRPWYMANREPSRIDAGAEDCLFHCEPGPV